MVKYRNIIEREGGGMGDSDDGIGIIHGGMAIVGYYNLASPLRARFKAFCPYLFIYLFYFSSPSLSFLHALPSFLPYSHDK